MNCIPLFEPFPPPKTRAHNLKLNPTCASHLPAVYSQVTVDHVMAKFDVPPAAASEHLACARTRLGPLWDPEAATSSWTADTALPLAQYNRIISGHNRDPTAALRVYKRMQVCFRSAVCLHGPSPTLPQPLQSSATCTQGLGSPA